MSLNPRVNFHMSNVFNNLIQYHVRFNELCAFLLLCQVRSEGAFIVHNYTSKWRALSDVEAAKNKNSQEQTLLSQDWESLWHAMSLRLDISMTSLFLSPEWP